MKEMAREGGAGKSSAELLDGICQHLEGRVTDLADVADEMRDIRAMDGCPGEGHRFDLANSYEEVADLSDPVFILYRLEEVARLPDSDIPPHVADDLNEAWKSLCVASTTLRFHARHIRGTAGTPIPLPSAPRREMAALTHIETAVSSIESVKTALNEAPATTEKSPKAP